MKRFAAFIIAFMYLSTSMGATIHLHFCMGKVISWSLVEVKNSHCPKCGMITKAPGNATTVSGKDCCHEESTQLKSGIDQKYSPTVPAGFPSITILPDAQAAIISSSLGDTTRANAPDHAPPALSGPHIFLWNRNFRL